MEPILERVSAQDRDKLMDVSKKLYIPKNSLIFEGGRPAEYLYLIHKGKVRIFKQIEPNKDLTIFTRGVMDGFGEIGVFGARYYSNSARAMEDSVLYAVKRETIEETLAQDGRLSLHFTRWLAESLEASKAKMRDYIAFGSEGAVASIFVRYSNMHGVVTPEGIRITEPIMIQDVSRHIAISRETVSRIVNKWKEQGVIAKKNKYFLIKDMNYFRKMLACEQCNVENCVL
ncbi:Crp/Fnr family transcriptional regulator [Lentibacillus sp. CBA3610]|uniref:Crp/Fnr family transcriptional regulator n=1 Tax=Lentibacillus sp. CBA3610 TaxID=2518176 RepID=UPI001595E7EA|nr:Crp/Fnr family transcriptional regulator [Lentibacillus sp. CBA3610]QKY68462.1 Crp/Fnr family transcriptional regulator [Lentibacillus sp. CBA3610]